MNAENDDMISRMIKIPRGASHWKNYQDICGEILTELFVPPLDRPYEENLTDDRLDRRDWIFSNHAYKGFWHTMMDRYDAEIVLVDAKNYTDKIGKEQVVPVRNYLLRTRSLGRFAIIMSRLPPSESAKKERQEALHEEKAMILFLCDKDVSKMLWLKTIGEEPSYLLDKQRIDVQLRG